MHRSQVAEPFRSDPRFWRSVAASAGAAFALVLAVAVAVPLALTVGGLWCLVPFAVPAVFLVRAALTGRASARANRAAFGSKSEWREAERQAVVQAFRSAMTRRRSDRVQA
jgi:hypothetical protein